ncbi:Nonstructural polyprotein [Anopheles sinensis]|uniref:Nonstructural polyprotein n=1 Tax=Anopheles sinensis TaxID=74873 RepID=A0A084W6R0_ANOSI|nr:Nonstructural polyprotein [Anopheles sinensis]
MLIGQTYDPPRPSSSVAVPAAPEGVVVNFLGVFRSIATTHDDGGNSDHGLGPEASDGGAKPSKHAIFVLSGVRNGTGIYLVRSGVYLWLDERWSFLHAEKSPPGEVYGTTNWFIY